MRRVQNEYTCLAHLYIDVDGKDAVHVRGAISNCLSEEKSECSRRIFTLCDLLTKPPVSHLLQGASRRTRVQSLPTFFSQRDRGGWCDDAARGDGHCCSPAPRSGTAHTVGALFSASPVSQLSPPRTHTLLTRRASRDSAATSATAPRREYKRVSLPTQAHCYNIVQSPLAIFPQSTALRYMCDVVESSHKSNKQI